MDKAARVAGILLTGGASKRMGFDKMTLEVGGAPNTARLAALLRGLVATAVEVGSGCSGLPAVREEPPGSGPLAAVSAGALALDGQGFLGPVLVVAGDMPNLGSTVLEYLAAWPGEASVVPLVGGRLQPLCARWSAGDLRLAVQLVAAGERSMRALLARSVPDVATAEKWPRGVTVEDFADVDELSDLAAWKLSPPRPSQP
ncbi:MAG TPA: molybdenum cofactor guanylyltransferase [Acidimicrobiales bacterium]|nr:molybdenum cofactor guanylyltransferase [Acidimicrobiales bacterium]